MIALKAMLLGFALSALGTVSYIVFLFFYGYQETRRLYPTGGIGFDITSLPHNTIYAAAYWLFVIGLFATGCGIVFLWPRPVIVP